MSIGAESTNTTNIESVDITEKGGTGKAEKVKKLLFLHGLKVY